jgi:hypothetical protein
MSEPIRVQRGRLVRETWVTWAKRQRRPKASWLIGWDDLDADQREVDMLIGDAVAAAERERCASLAESAGATYLDPCDDDDQQRRLHTHHRRPFADLIRKEPGSG